MSDLPISRSPSEKHSHTNLPCHTRLHNHFLSFTWSWFLLPLASLGLSLLLANLPLRFDGLNAIGKVFYLLGVTEFVILGIFITLRLCTKRGVFRRSITKDSEAYFFSIVMMCIASIIQGAHVYSNPKEGSRLSDAYRVVFWIYAPVAFLFALGMYSLLFTSKHHLQAANMTPAWMLPMFPVILTAPTAGIVASSLNPEQAFSVHFCGILYMGLGLLMAIMSMLRLASIASSLLIMGDQFWQSTSSASASPTFHLPTRAQACFSPSVHQLSQVSDS